MTDAKTRIRETLDRIEETENPQNSRRAWLKIAARWLRCMRRPLNLADFTLSAKRYTDAMRYAKEYSVVAMRIRNYRG